MGKRPEDPQQWIADVIAKLRAGEPVRVQVPGKGRLLLERTFPFICIYRQTPGVADAGTPSLVTAEASYLLVRDTKGGQVQQLLEQLVPFLHARFGAVLLLEIWAGQRVEASCDSEHEPGPAFVIHAPETDALEDTVDVLSRNLAGLRERRTGLSAHVAWEKSKARPSMPPLVSGSTARRYNCHWLGLQVPPTYRSSDGKVYPLVLRRLRGFVSRCIKRACHRFAAQHSSTVWSSYHALGQRLFVKAVWEADARLAEVAASFDFLLQVTPINEEQVWRGFKRSRFQERPPFRYRSLPIDPARTKRELYAMPIDRIDDPTLAQLFSERRKELDRRLTMLTDMETPAFLYGSLALHGPVSDYHLRVARRILSSVPARPRAERSEGVLDAEQFAELARKEVAIYAEKYPPFSPPVIVRDDIHSGVLVSHGRLLVGAGARVPAKRAAGLVAHEVGTHLLTHFNGKVQPFRQMSLGLAGYEEMQEGLAVLAEYFVGGLTAHRLRVLAARLLAASRLARGESFARVFAELHEEHRFEQRQAFTITMRIFRGGGLLKDAVYLRGLLQSMKHIRRGGELEPLFVGRLAAHHIPLIRELEIREVVLPVPLEPRYLITDLGRGRLAKLTIIHHLFGAFGS